MPGVVPEYVMSLLHSSVVHQVALATFHAPSELKLVDSNNNDVSSTGAVAADSTPKTPATMGTQQQQSSPPAASVTPRASVPPTPTAANNHTNNSATGGKTSSSTIPLVCHTADKATEFYHRLEQLGFTIGLRVAERLLCSQQVSSAATEKPQEDAINLIRTVLWPALFGKDLGKEADAAGQQQQQQQQQQPHAYKLIDADFSWTRSISLPPDGMSLADPFLRGPQVDMLEDATAFAAGLSQQLGSAGGGRSPVPASASKQQQQQHQQHTERPDNNKPVATKKKLTTGPNDYVVVLTGILLGFLSTLGFGSHAERRVFGGERACVSAFTPSMLALAGGSGGGGSAATTPSESGSTVGTGSFSGAVVARPPSSFVTVRHRLLPRDGETLRPTGMQLKLVVHFS